jgi:hypothetical protein
MLIFISDGRLGNQIFQYAFLQTIRKPGEKIIVFGFDDLITLFEGINRVIIVPYEKGICRFFLKRIIYKFLEPLLKFIANIGIISTIQVEYDYINKIYRREKTSFNEKLGFIKQIRFVKKGYFQSESFFSNGVLNTLRIKEQYMDKAKKILAYIPNSAPKIFVHIRIGDYKNFTVFGKDVLLPMGYYKNLVDWFLANFENPYFIILSDDPHLVVKEFEYVKNKIISTENHYGVDFAIMTMCEYGILSPSSYSWWGAYFMKNRRLVFCPKYWLGFKSRIEYHQGTEPSFCEKIDVMELVEKKYNALNFLNNILSKKVTGG